MDEPALTVMADGLGGDSISHWHVEDDGMPEAALAQNRADGKPPYRVPLMTEVAAIPWNGLTVASTFAGCGGSSLGYRMAGYRVMWANEFVPAAQESYRANMSEWTTLDPRDIKVVSAEEIIRELMAKGLTELDVLDGSPPCQAFSTAGKRSKGWGEDKRYEHGAKQKNEELFTEYIRLLRGLRPRAFVAENVSGLVKGVAKGFFLEILVGLKASGYRVQARILDAQWLGVPQQRQRVIFVGVREDLGLDPAFPDPLPYRYSIRDACPWIASAKSGPTGFGAGSISAEQPAPTVPACPTVLATQAQQFVIEQQPEADKIANGADISRYAIAREYDQLPQGERSFFGGASLARAHEDRPSPCVTAAGGVASIASVTHPTERRKFSIAELKRICSFPDDMVLTGSYAQQWERLGNSVPPLMMRAVAEVLRDRVLLPSKK